MLAKLESGFMFILMFYVLLASFLGLIFIFILKSASKMPHQWHPDRKRRDPKHKKPSSRIFYLLSFIFKLLLLPLWLLLESFRFLLHIIHKSFLRLPYRLRQIIFILAFLAFLAVAAQSIFKPKTTQAAWYDEDWLFRQKISAVFPVVTSAQTNVDTLFTIDTSTLVTAGKLQSDCDDLRFTNLIGVTLTYYLYSGCNTTTTKIWVRVDSIPATSSRYDIFMYYGNSGATIGSTTIDALNGLIAYWKMNENSWKNTSEEIKDTSVTAGHGVAVKDATTTTSGKYNDGGIFDGDADVGNLYTTAFSNAFSGTEGTALIWAKLNSSSEWTDGLGHTIFRFAVNTDNLIRLHKPTTNNRLNWQYIANADNDIYSKDAVSTTDWFMMGITWSDSANESRIYFDGALESTISVIGTWAGSLATDSVALGAFTTGGANPWFGSLDDFRFYNRALSTTEISDIYNSPGAIASVDYEVSNPDPNFNPEEKFNGQPVAQWKFDEGTGTIANNSVEGNLPGSISGATWQTEDLCVGGKCLFFDGTDDVVTVTNQDIIDLNIGLTSAFTLSSWFKANSDGEGDLGQIFQKGTTTYIRTSGQSGSNINIDASLDLATTDATVSISAPVTTNTWNHIAMVYTDDSDDEIDIYINGRIVASSVNGSGAPATESNNLLIGGTTTANYHGFLDNFKIYNTAKTADQIKADFNAGRLAAQVEKGANVLGASRDQLNQILSNGLVGYWKMDESSWTNDCSTTSVTDSSGNGNNGKACPATTGPTGGAVGKFGNGGSFDGSDDNITLGNPSTLQITGSKITLSAWIKPDAFSGQQGIIGKWQNGPSDASYDLNSVDSGVVHCNLNTDANNNIASATGVLTVSVWNHVVCTYDGNNAVIYVNGVAVKTQAVTGNIQDSDNTVYVGYYQALDKYFDGSIDEARIYNRALSPAEVSLLYNFAPGPVGYWNFEEGSGTSANDSSSLANTLTLSTDSWSTGKFGKALNGVGSNWASRADDSDFDFAAADNFSVGAWIKSDSATNPSANEYLIDKEAGIGYAIYITTSGLVTFGIDDDATWTPDDTAASTADVYDGYWHHVMAVKTGTTKIEIYVDGVLVGSDSTIAATGTLANADSLTVGDQDATDDTDDFNGDIDEVKIYNYARTQKQIIEDLNAGHPFGGSPIGTQVGYWKMDEGYGTSAYDSGTLLKTLTLSTASWTNSGKFGKAWNGTGALWLSRADDPDFDFAAADDFSISLWVKSDSATNPAAAEYLVDKEAGIGYAVYFNTSGQLVFGIDDDVTWTPDDTATAATDFYDATWHYVTAAKTGTSKIAIYVDGVLRNENRNLTATGTLENSDTLTVGDQDATDDTDDFNGDIDELKIYRAALTAEEVKSDYNQGQSLVLGNLGTNTNYATQASNQQYCVPGDTSTCTAPVGDWGFEEGSGTTANDISTGGNSLTLSTESWSTGKIGKALNGIGSNWASRADDDEFDFAAADNFSLSLWFKSDSASNPSAAEYLLDKEAGTGYAIYITTGGLVTFGIDSDGTWTPADTAASTADVYDGTWHHVVAVKTGTTKIEIFVDGISVGSDSTIAATGSLANTDTLTVGDQDATDNTNDFNGDIDQVRIYNYARSQAQIAWEYNRSLPLAHWKFDECSGTSTYDSANNLFTGTITPGGSGQTGAGTCTSSADTFRYDGRNGKYNYSLDFDGTDDYVEISDRTELRFDASTQDFSIFAWAKRDTTSATQYIVSKEDADDDGYRLQFNSGNTITCSVDTIDITSALTVTDTNWHHVGCTIDRDGRGSVYLDGVLAGATVAISSEVMATTATVRIGARAYTAANYFDGLLDDIKIFNYALTAEQVKLLYNQASAIQYAPISGAP